MSMTALDFAIAILATYRVARMVADEDGPARVLARLREAASDRGPTWLADGLSCPLCASVWIAPALLAVGRTTAGAWLVAALAVSGAASWLYLAERE